MRAEISREEEQRSFDYEEMVAEMTQNCGPEAARNPLFMAAERKWRWDFTTGGGLPRLVRLLPKEVKFNFSTASFLRARHRRNCQLTAVLN